MSDSDRVSGLEHRDRHPSKFAALWEVVQCKPSTLGQFGEVIHVPV